MTTKRLPPVFAVVLQPIQAFFRLEAASGILLMICAAVAMIWANSPWGGLYRDLLHLPLTLGIAGRDAHFTLHHLVNDGLMAVFFLLVGLEIKRELVVGELRTFRQAVLPAIAAAGGMVVPAAVYLAFNRGGVEATGWAIPMATDIAFSIGVLTLLKARVGTPLVIFLTALAIFDDLGGILVIALFYGGDLHVSWLLASLVITGVLFLLNRFGVRSFAPYVLLGVALWYAMHHGGIHATISGVLLGMMIPARSRRSAKEVLRELHAHATGLLDTPADEDLRNEQLLVIEETIEDLEPPLNRMEHGLHGYVAFGIVPVFALVNSGVSLEGMSWAGLLAPLPLGIALGLFVGKQLGIFAFTAVAVRWGVSPIPGGASLRQLHGVSVVAGIGFTVALFVASLAFAEHPALLDQAKLGILVGSFVSAVVGYALLRLAPVPRAPPTAAATNG